MVLPPVLSGLEFSSLEIKYDIFRHGDEETWIWLSTLLRTDSVLKFVVTLAFRS